jgi:hypothetical protein
MALSLEWWLGNSQPAGGEKTWGERRGSNPRHLGPQPSALPAELRPPCAVRVSLPFPQGDFALGLAGR